MKKNSLSLLQKQKINEQNKNEDEASKALLKGIKNENGILGDDILRIWTTNEEIVKIVLKKLENMYVSDYIIYRKHYAYTDNYYFYTVSLFEYIKWKLKIS